MFFDNTYVFKSSSFVVYNLWLLTFFRFFNFGVREAELTIHLFY